MRLAEYYGRAFTYGDEPTATWIYHLHDLSAEQIGNGIRNLPRHESDFAPNPGQFRDLCLTNFDWERQAHKLMFRTAPQLEDMGAKEKRIAFGLDALRALREQVKL